MSQATGCRLRGSVAPLEPGSAGGCRRPLPGHSVRPRCLRFISGARRRRVLIPRADAVLPSLALGGHMLRRSRAILHLGPVAQPRSATPGSGFSRRSTWCRSGPCRGLAAGWRKPGDAAALAVLGGYRAGLDALRAAASPKPRSPI